MALVLRVLSLALMMTNGYVGTTSQGDWAWEVAHPSTGFHRRVFAAICLHCLSELAKNCCVSRENSSTKLMRKQAFSNQKTTEKETELTLSGTLNHYSGSM
jgi:hypothetical protein